MFSTEDTIVAIATPPGRGGIGVVRISGPQALSVASALLAHRGALEPRRATFTKFSPGPLRGTRTTSGPLGGTRPTSGPLGEPPPTSGPLDGIPSPPVGRVRPQADPPDVGDDVVATFFPAPRSYTAQDIVEISAHGSPVILNTIVRAAIDAGARLAQPGEFTLRAFLNGKLDLVQAEAVADLVEAATPLQARVAFDQLEGTLTTRIGEIDRELFDLIARLEASLDFPDEGFHFIEPKDVARSIDGVLARLGALLADGRRGRMIREGATVVIAGRTNVGKSSIFNTLLGSERAIVTATAGTTRDVLAERVDIGGMAVTLVDTAGVRESEDPIEYEGVTRGAKARAVASLVLLVFDATEGILADDRAILASLGETPRLVVANKSDAGDAVSCDAVDLFVSARTGAGIEELRIRIASTLLDGDPVREGAALSNLRHITLLGKARELLERAAVAARHGTAEEFLLADLQAARARFDEIVGRRTPDDVLAHIFERFCIGK